jgi:hypothetical protein
MLPSLLEDYSPHFLYHKNKSHTGVSICILESRRHLPQTACSCLQKYGLYPQQPQLTQELGQEFWIRWLLDEVDAKLIKHELQTDKTHFTDDGVVTICILLHWFYGNLYIEKRQY